MGSSIFTGSEIKIYSNFGIRDQKIASKKRDQLEKNIPCYYPEITVNLDFRCSYKSKNKGEKLLPRSLAIVMKLFEATSWFF